MVCVILHKNKMVCVYKFHNLFTLIPPTNNNNNNNDKQGNFIVVFLCVILCYLSDKHRSDCF